MRSPERIQILILSFGEILFDIFPASRRLGGAPFNFAYHLRQLNGPVRFLSRIGQDPEGREILDFLGERQFPVHDLQLDTEHPTGRVMVTVDKRGTPQFDILPGVAYDFIASTPSIERFVAENCRLIYFGSLIQRTPQAARTLRGILRRRSPRTKCLFDVNMRPGCLDTDSLDYSLQETDILKLNDDELATLAAMQDIHGDTAEKVAAIMTRFDIEVVALTRAERGSCLFKGDDRHDIQPTHDIQIKDTVGAGDAFAAMLAIGYIRNWPAERILASANRLATDVCGIEGAIPDDPAFYNRHREALANGSDNG